METDVFNLTHADIGESIACNWNLPEDLVMAIGYHHNSKKIPDIYSKMIMTLHIADCFCQDNGFGFIEDYSQNNSFFEECLSRLQIQPYALDLIMKDVHQEIQKHTNTGILL